jgi:hypothetical protein
MSASLTQYHPLAHRNEPDVTATDEHQKHAAVANALPQHRKQESRLPRRDADP